MRLLKRFNMNRTNFEKDNLTYSAPEIDVIEIKSEGCLCNSIQTSSSDPDDFEYGGKL